MSTIVGIDPGLEGALAVLVDGVLTDAMDLIHVDNILDARELAITLQGLNLVSDGDIVVVERVGAFPQNGSIGNFKLGYSFGAISGTVRAIGLPLDTTTPAMWKKRLGLAGHTKDASRLLIRDLYPAMAHLFERKADVGRADAACIALDYYRRTLG